MWYYSRVSIVCMRDHFSLGLNCCRKGKESLKEETRTIGRMIEKHANLKASEIAEAAKSEKISEMPKIKSCINSGKLSGG